MSAESELLKLLNGSPQQRNQGMEQFFTQPGLRAGAIRHLRWRGATKEEAVEAYQEGYKSFYKVFLKGNFAGESSLKTFFFSVCRNRWRDGKRRKTDRHFDPTQRMPVSEKLSTAPAINTRLDQQDRKQFINQLLEKMGENCRELILWKYDGYSDDEIQKKLNLDTSRPIRKQRFTCMKKLRDTLIKKPILAQRLQQFYRYE